MNVEKVDALAQEIRRVDGNHQLGAGALAEALWPFIVDSADVVPRRMSKMPMRVPVWLWIAYHTLVAGLAILATLGSMIGIIAVMMCAAFSFQFWTFAVWRGLRKRVEAWS